MKTILSLIAILMIIISCSVTPVTPSRPGSYNGYSVEEALLPHVIEFEKKCKVSVKLNVYFADFSYLNKIMKMIGRDFYAIGMCSPFFFGDVYIDKNWWFNTYNYYHKEELMFHELGHCVLHRWHNDDKDKFGMEKSVMSSTMFASYYQYEAYREDYIKELCNN